MPTETAAYCAKASPRYAGAPMPDAALRAESVRRTLTPAQAAAYRRRIWPWRRRIAANLRYVKKPFRDFLPLLLGLVGLLVLGGLAFRAHYPPTHSFGAGLYTTWSLVFGEAVNPWPEHWLPEVFCILMPPVGLVVILDGIVRFSYHILRRDETGQEWIRAVTQTLRDHVILCGLGKVGFRVLQKLVLLGERVVVLEKNPQCENLAWARGHGIPVRIGSGREAGIFEDLHTAAAKSIILATDDDLANLEMALDARKVKPGIHVVMRMYDQELAEKIRESMDIQLAFSTAELTAPLFATASSDRSILNAFYVGERLLVVARVSVQAGSELVGQSIGDLRRAHQAFVLTHRRNGQPALNPADDTRLAAGDLLTIQCEPEALRAVHRRNRDTAAVV